MGIVPEKRTYSNVSTARMGLALWDNGEVLEIPRGSGMQQIRRSQAKGRRKRGEN